MELLTSTAPTRRFHTVERITILTHSVHVSTIHQDSYVPASPTSRNNCHNSSLIHRSSYTAPRICDPKLQPPIHRSFCDTRDHNIQEAWANVMLLARNEPCEGRTKQETSGKITGDACCAVWRGCVWSSPIPRRWRSSRVQDSPASEI